MKLRLPKKLLSALLLACFMAAGSAYADYTWSGTGEITNEEWNKPSNWTVDGASSALPSDKGPGVAQSNAWRPIIVNNATGTVGTLEGWNVDMRFENTTLTIGEMIKIQNGAEVSAGSFNLQQRSTITLNLGTGQQQSMLVTLDGTSTMNLNLSKDRTAGATTIKYGDLTAENVGKLNLGRKSGATGSYTSNLTIDGTISTGPTSEETTLHTVTLGTIGEGITLGTIDSSIRADGYSRAYGTLTASAYDIGTYSIVNENGTLKLLYVTGTLTEYTWDGSNGSWNDASWNSGSTFVDGNKVIINGGNLSLAADTSASARAVALNGGLLEIAGSLKTWSLSIADSASIKLSGGSLTADALNTAQGLEISGDSTLNISGDSSSILLGTGNLKKTGSGILDLGASLNSTMSGELTITGGVVKWGTDENSSNTIAFSKIIVDGSSSQFYLSHARVDMSGQTGVELKNGGTLYSDDTDFALTNDRESNQIAFGGLNVTGTGGKIQYNWGGSFSFEKLTGDANLSIVNGDETSWTIFKSIKDCHGEISSASDKHTIKLGTVDLAAGKTTTISGKFGSIGETVTKKGEGKLILAGNGVDATTLDIQGGTVSWGSKKDDINARDITTVLGFSKVVINSGAKFEDSHKGGNTTTFDIEMKGGTLHAYDQNMGDSNALVKYGTLTIANNTRNSISQEWKAYRNFAILTGGESGGDVSRTTLAVGGCTDKKQTLRIDSVTNFNGTLSSSSFDNESQLLSIGAASQEEGFNAVIDAKATLTDGFEKTGAGTLTLSKSTKATGSVAIKAGTLSFTVSNEAMSVSEDSVITISGTGKFSHGGFNYTAKKVSSTVTEATEGSTSGSNAATITAGTGIGDLGLGNANLAIKDAVMEKTSAGAENISATLSNVDFTVSGGTDSGSGYTVKFMGSAAQSLSKLTIQSGNKVEVANSNFSTSVLDNSGALQLAKAAISIETIVLSGGTVTLGTESDHDAVLSTGSLSVSGNSTVNANLVLDGSSLTLNNALAMGSALTLNDITLSGDLLSGYIAKNSVITLFTGVDSLTLGTASASAAEITVGSNVDASDYFTNLGQGDFLLTYTGGAAGSNGIVALVAQRDIPEPTTATLSLLALMGLAARRRRRKA